MSAILSVFNRNDRPVDRQLVDTMLSASRDRAVDGQDIWINDNIALAHQHFWITPQEWGERQPLVDQGGCRFIVADARLDNRDELLRFFELDDAQGKQISDASLILLAYRRWGTDCARRFLGDFAFAIWDAEEQHLFIARDVLGARGLCYAVDKNVCLVGSEVSILLAHPNITPRINDGKIAEFLCNLGRDQEETFYEGIAYCPPAHCLVVTAHSVRKWHYWEIDSQARIRYKDEQEYGAHFLELLTEAVRCRLRTVGPVGVSMSGGLDSTSLAAVAGGLLPQVDLPQKRLKSFSYVFDELTSCDERAYIQPVVDQLQLDATYVPCDDEWTLRDIDNWPSSKGYVFKDPYARLPVAVTKAAQKAGCRVLLAGYYGDVLFLGGHSWAAGMMSDLRVGQLAKTLQQHRDKIDVRRDLGQNGLRHMIPHRFRKHYWRERNWDWPSHYPGLHPNLAERVQLQKKVDIDQSKRHLFGPDQWHRFLSLTPNSLAQGFSATRFLYNRYGVEISLPYWDRRLIEFVMAVPADQLGRPQRDRWLLRDAIAGLLPEVVRERRLKTSFLPLMGKGLLLKEKDTVEKLVDEPLIEAQEYIRKEWLRNQLMSGAGWSTVHNANFLWKCLSLELWLKMALSIPTR